MLLRNVVAGDSYDEKHINKDELSSWYSISMHQDFEESNAQICEIHTYLNRHRWNCYTFTNSKLII